MKKFILAVSILAIAEIIVLLILHIFYVYQFTFNDYMEELYGKFGLIMDFEDGQGNAITEKFEELFNNYFDEWYGLGHAALSFFSFLILFLVFIFMLSFMITYLCHLRRKGCCRCKKCYSMFTIIFSMIVSIPYIYYAYEAEYKIDLSDDVIYSFDDDFNKRTRKNIRFMKIRRIILITGVSILYAMYIVHLLLLCLNNHKIVIEIQGTVLENNNINNNNVEVNQVQIITTNENRISESK